MPVANPSAATVRHALLKGKKVPACLSTLDNTCAAGGQCPQVQGSTAAKQQHLVLLGAVTTAHTSLTNKQAAAQTLQATTHTLALDFAAVKLALRSYEASVGTLAKGDAAIISAAGLLARSTKVIPLALGKVTVVSSKHGKHPGQAVLSWHAAPGARGYVIEVNFTPASPSGPWTALTAGTGRRRVVKAPAAASDFLARIAALGTGGTQSDWSDPVLATTL